MRVIAAVLQELRLDLENTVEVERVAAQHFRKRDVAALRPVQPGIGIDAADARFHLGQRVGRHQVRLVEQNDVGESDLILRLGRIVQPVLQPSGVGDGHHGVELGFAADVLVHEKRLRHRRGIGEARGLHDDRVELALAPHQPIDDAHEVAAHGAADAAVVHLEHFLVDADHELAVDADLAEFIDDDRVFLPVRLAQDAVEQRGLPRAEIAGENGNGHLVGHASLRFGPYICMHRQMPCCS